MGLACLPRLGAAALAAGLHTGCAHAPAPPIGPGGPGPARPPSAVVTGSRLPQRVDPGTGRATTADAVRTYHRADLDRTGRPDVGAALLGAVPMGP